MEYNHLAESWAAKKFNRLNSRKDRLGRMLQETSTWELGRGKRECESKDKELEEKEVGKVGWEILDRNIEGT